MNSIAYKELKKIVLAGELPNFLPWMNGVQRRDETRLTPGTMLEDARKQKVQRAIHDIIQQHFETVGAVTDDLEGIQGDGGSQEREPLPSVGISDAGADTGP